MSTCPTCKTTYPDTMRLCPTDGTVLEGGQAPKDENMGRTLDGKYRLDKRLSSGGMGTVYKATHLMLGKSVAVKLIKADLPASPEVVRRFQREAKAASELNHPNIAPAYDLGQTQDGTLYIAMEYIDGQSLKDVIQASPMAPDRTIRLLKQVASALALAHRHEIIHRDLKPQNIMITKDADGREVAKLLDFGIAKTLDDSATQLTATGFSLGTPQYMSPEQAYGRPVDGRSDLYSLGIILYEMLIGEVPFNDPSTPAVLVKQMTEAPIPPALKRPDLQVSPELAAIALKCLEKDPTKRYQSADEFSLALDAAAMSLGTTVPTLPGQSTGTAASTAAATVVIGKTTRAQPAPASAPGPSGQTTQVASAPAAAPASETIRIDPKAGESPAPAVFIAPAGAPAVESAAKMAAKPVPAAGSPTARPSGGGSRAVVAAAVAIVLLGGAAYAAYEMGWIKTGGSTPATQLASSTTTAAPPPAPSTAATPAATPADPNAGSTSAPGSGASNAAANASGSGNGTAPPASAAPPAAPPSNPSSPAKSPAPGTTSVPSTSSGPSKPSTHAAPLATSQAPASSTTAAPGPNVAAGAPPTTTGAATPGASKSAPQVGAPTPTASAPAAAPLPANPSVAFRCDGPPNICSALKSAMDQALAKDSMTSIRDASKAEIALEGTVTFVDEQAQRMFGTSFTIRNYTIDVSGEARRTSESVPMPSAATLNYDARYTDRLDEKARLVAASVVENIRAFWKKK